MKGHVIDPNLLWQSLTPNLSQFTPSGVNKILLSFTHLDGLSFYHLVKSSTYPTNTCEAYVTVDPYQV